MNFVGSFWRLLSSVTRLCTIIRTRIRLGLRMQLLLFTVLLVGTTAGICSQIALSRERKILESHLLARGETLTQNLASSASNALTPRPDEHRLADLLRETLSDKAVGYALIVDEDGKIVAHSDLSMWGQNYNQPIREVHNPVEKTTMHIYSSARGQEYYDFSAPVISSRKTELGTAHLGMPVSLVQRSLGHTKKNLLFAALILAAVGGGLAVAMGYLITQPLAVLSMGAKRIGDGDLGYRIELERNDEYGLLAQRINTMTAKLGELYFRTLQMLINALEAKDIYGRGHTERVTRYSVQIARKMGLELAELENVRRAAMIHDIGKIGVREAILHKNGELTKEEYDHVKSHVSWGTHILKPMRSLARVVSYLSHHHEHFDGSGYPAGLSSSEIPLGARIIAVADTFDAMTSDRPYRKAMTVRDAMAELKRCAGSQFDPDVVSALIKILKSAKAENLKRVDS